MRVLHINTLTSGGAAKAAIRQHFALLEASVDSQMIFLFGDETGLPNCKVLNPKISIIKRAFNKINCLKNESYKNEQLKKKLKGKFEFISFPTTDYKKDLILYTQKADIINLHWVANFVDYPSFFLKVSKPIVWTLHDMNPFLGIYHYSNDELENQENAYIDSNVKSIKFKAINKAGKVSFVCPSIWISDELHKSKFSFFSSYCIPNSLDVNVFRLQQLGEVRRELDIPNEKKVFLFISEDFNNTRKGFDLLIDAFNYLDNPNIFLCAIGNGSNLLGLIRHSIKLIGRIDDEKILAKYYAAADAFILPSRQDNLPNVMLESLVCGTPVISFEVGGMKDVIQNNKNGILANKIDAEGLANAIKSFLLKGVEWSREKIRNEAVNQFSPKVQAASLIEVYKQVLDEGKVINK